MIGIYKITNPKGKIYIGKSINIEKRFNTYKNLHCKSQRRLYNSLVKHGVENHLFEVIFNCEEKDLLILEKYYQEFYQCTSKNGLNCFINGSDKEKRIYEKKSLSIMSNCRKGKKQSLTKEQREKKSIMMSGNKNPMFGRNKEKNPFFGKKHTDKTKSIISKKMQKENHPFFGKKRPEHSLKIKGENHYNWGKKSEKTSIMNRQRIGLRNPNSKIYLDTNTGVFYYSSKDYCFIHNIHKSTFKYRFKKNKIQNLIIA